MGDYLEKMTAELRRLEEDCTHSGKSHFNAADRWGTYNFMLGLPSVVLSAAAGTAFIKDWGSLAASMTTVVAVLTGLMTFLKPSERAASHKSAGAQYLTLRNDSRVYREIGINLATDIKAAFAAITALTKRRNDLNQSSPQFSDGDRKKAKAGIEAGEATHEVDRS
jgi:hypothetical protein